jgi:hypothetical protein
VLNLFRNKSPYTVLILLIITLVLKSGVMVLPQAPVKIEGYFLYNGIINVFNVLLGGSAFLYTFLSVVMLFTQALYLNFVATRHRLYMRPTYFPAFVFVLLTSVHPNFNYFSVPLLVNWCVLIGLDICLSFNHSTSPRKNLFNAAFVFAIAGLLHFSGVGFLLVFLAALMLLRPFNAGEWTVAAMGYLTPFYFAAAVLFIVDMLPALAHWPDLDFVVIRKIKFPMYLSILGGGLLALVGSGIFAMQQQMPKATIYVRRSWVAVFLYLVMSCLVAMFGETSVNNAWLLTIPGLSMFIAHALMMEKSKWFSNFIFYFSIILVLVCQWAFNK